METDDTSREPSSPTELERANPLKIVENDKPSKSAQQEFLWHTHDYLGEYARFADAKAGFAGTLAGALLGCLYAADLFSALIKTSIRQWTWVMWATACGGLILCIAIALAVRVVYPRLRHSKNAGVVFWEAIAAFGTKARFRAAFCAKTDEDLIEALQQQVFDVAKWVLVPKYRNVSLCLWALILGGILAGTALLFKDAGETQTSPRPTPTVQVPLR